MLPVRLGNSLPVIDHKQAAPKKITAQMRHSCALSLPKKEFCHNRRTTEDTVVRFIPVQCPLLLVIMIVGLLSTLTN
jgi:hypothetical protein